MVNLTELFKHVTPERHWQSVLVNAEALTAEVLPAASAAAGRHIEQGVVIIDLKGFRHVIDQPSALGAQLLTCCTPCTFQLFAVLADAFARE